MEGEARRVASTVAQVAEEEEEEEEEVLEEEEEERGDVLMRDV